MSLRIIYAGTPEFAAVALQRLIVQGEHQIVAVYTQPDRPAGRGRKLAPSPVKALAQQHNIPVQQPASLKGEVEQAQLRGYEADLMVVAAYGLLLPLAVLESPRLGCINIHASLLPRWRGAAPIQRAIIAGDPQTGITIMQMDVGLDTGAMLAKVTTPITTTTNSATLHDTLAQLGGEALLAALPQLEAGLMHPEPQDEQHACYASKLIKGEAEIDWSQSADALLRLINGYNPWPVAQTRYGDKVLRLWEAAVIDSAITAAPGTVVATSKQGVDVACGQGTLRLTTLQLPGKRPLDAASFVNAHDLSGVTLGGA